MFDCCVPPKRSSSVATTGSNVHALGKGVRAPISQSEPTNMAAPSRQRLSVMLRDLRVTFAAVKARRAPRANSQARVRGL